MKKCACLLLLLGWTSVRSPVAAQGCLEIHLTTPDKVDIVGTYYSVPVRQAPAVVLVHGWRQSRADWQPLVPLLQKAGIAVLAMDLRGHGKSTREMTAIGPALVDPKEFTLRDFQKMQLDISVAVEWLEENPDIDRNRIALVGGALGANLALCYATANEDLAALVLLSPSLNHNGIRADDAMRKLRPLPLRIVVSHNDPVPFESSRLLMEIREELVKTPKNSDVIICTGPLQGIEMLRGVSGLPDSIAVWLKQVLLGSSPQSPAK